MPITIKCQICDKEFQISPSRIKRNKRFCSLECKIIWLKDWLSNGDAQTLPHWKGGKIKRICAYCGKQIEIKKHKEGKRVFCSQSCAASVTTKERPIERVIRICKTCGKCFEIHPNKLKRKDRRQGLYCSITCRAIDNIRHQRKQDTDIEKILENWLKDNTINYEKQKIIDGICIVDFFIPPKICLFADGDYWHSRRQELDKKQTWQLLNGGYEVIRLLGSEIKKGVRPNALLQYSSESN